MKKFSKVLCYLFLVIIMIHFLLPEKPYIKTSKIHGDGLFAGKNYKKGDVIFENIFPYKDKNEILFNPITSEKFNRYILNELKYLNHCSVNRNVKVTSDDYKRLYLVAIKDIKKHEELYDDYNEINKFFPFIRAASPSFVKC